MPEKEQVKVVQKPKSRTLESYHNTMFNGDEPDYHTK